MVSYLLHLFFPFALEVLCETELPVSITAPREELGVLGRLIVFICWVHKREACTYFAVVNHFIFNQITLEPI